MNRTRAYAANPAGPKVTSRIHGTSLITIQSAGERSEQIARDTPAIYSRMLAALGVRERPHNTAPGASAPFAVQLPGSDSCFSAA